MPLYDSREIEVTARPRPGSFWFGPERHEGLAIAWPAGCIMFRRGEETMCRVRNATAA